MFFYIKRPSKRSFNRKPDKASFSQCRNPDTPTYKEHWVLIYIHFQIYSKAYETNEFV